MAGDDLVFPSNVADKVADNNFNNGTLFRSISVHGGYTLRGAKILLGEGGLVGTGSSNVINNDFYLGAGVDRTFNINSGSTLFVDGQIEGGNGMAKTGAGDLSLRANNSDLGQTDIVAGRLFIEKDNGLGAFSTAARTIIRGGAQLLINDNAIGTIRTDEPITLELGSGGILNVNSSGTFTSSSAFFIVNAGGDVNVGGGTLNVNSTLSHSGTLDLTSGTVNLGVNNHVVHAGSATNITGGTMNLNGNLTVNGIVTSTGAGAFTQSNGTTLTVQNAGSVSVGNTGIGSGAVINVNGPAAQYAATSFTLNSGSTVNLNGGAMQFVAGFNPNGGLSISTRARCASPHATLNGTVLTALLGSSQTLGAAKHLEVQGSASLQSPLTLAGGTFSVGDLSGGNLLTFNSGTLNVTNSGLTIGSGGAPGAVVHVAPGMTINQTSVSGNMVGSDGRLVLSGGTFNTAASLTNNGEVQLASPLTTLGGSFGQSFLILDKQSAGPINGFFAGLPEGSQLFVNGFEYTISYQGGDGNDIVLSAVPEPGTWALLGLGLAGAGGWWYRRRQERIVDDHLRAQS